MKRCHMCGGKFHESYFYKNSSKPDGLTAACKECHRAWRKGHYHRNKERVLASNRRWDKAHSDKCRAMSRIHYKEVHMLTGSRRESAAQDGATQPQQAIDGGTRDEQVREK
jgi:hypothetical protein